MALRKSQKEMAITLFVKAFSTTEDEESRKELCIQFSDAYEGSIKDWKNVIRDQIEDVNLKEEFIKLVNRDEKTDIKEKVVVEPLKREDLKQISYLASKELELMPWIDDENGKNSLVDFVNSGYSYVAKLEDVILGFVLAYKCPTYGGYYYLFIDTFVVNSDAQGNGIGKMLLQKLKENMLRNRIYSEKTNDQERCSCVQNIQTFRI